MKAVIKTVMSVEEALAVSIHLLEHGATPTLISVALINDGFSSSRTETIIRWAFRKIRGANRGK